MNGGLVGLNGLFIPSLFLVQNAPAKINKRHDEIHTNDAMK